MKKLVVTALSLLVIAPLSAGQGKAARTFERVTPAGVFTVQEVAEGGASSLGSGARNSAAGLVWNHPDGGLAWIGQSVSVGDRGTQVLSLHSLNGERVQLFSGFDSDPPTAIWNDTSLQGGDPLEVSSSSLGDHHVAMYWLGGNLQVSGYGSSSVTPLWTWSYTAGTPGYGRVAIDRDGTIVAVTVFDSGASENHLYFLDPDTGAELFTPHYSQPSSGLRGFDFSADGSTLYVHDGVTNVDIFNVASQTVVFSATTPGSFDSHCISGDGSKFAFGGFGTVKIWEKIGGSWYDYSFSTGSGNYGDEMDFSDDGSTLGFGVTQYSPSYGKCEAYIMDVASKSIVSHATWTSPGTYQDVCSGAAISRDGRYFALARWGDGLGLNHEVYVLEHTNNTPVASIDMRGSAFAVDIAADGQVTASCGKAVHANTYGNGGDVYCYDLGDEDLVVSGKPQSGQSFQLDSWGPAGGTYIAYYGTGDIATGLPTPFGTLYLDLLPAVTFMYVGTWPGTGFASDTINVPPAPVLVGKTLYVQLISSASPPGGWTLSQDYVTLTILP